MLKYAIFTKEEFDLQFKFIFVQILWIEILKINLDFSEPS